jgi:F420-dependent methylenetetrahydromethanopterin dehydrogenase
MHRPFLIKIHYPQKASVPVTKCRSETETKSYVLVAASPEMVAEIAQLPHSIIDIEKSWLC